MPIPESGMGNFWGQLQGNWITDPRQIIRGEDIPRINDREGDRRHLENYPTAKRRLNKGHLSIYRQGATHSIAEGRCWDRKSGTVAGVRFTGRIT